MKSLEFRALDQLQILSRLLTLVVLLTAAFLQAAVRFSGNAVDVDRGINGYATLPALPTGTKFKAIAAGQWFSLAVKEEGTVIGWSSDFLGFLAPQVPEGLESVIAVAVGGLHCLALKNDGSVVAWGDNGFGESTVPAEARNVVAISAGNNHSLALTKDGTVVAWGDNMLGQTSVPKDLRGVVAISAAGYTSVALKSDGSIVAWGSNFQGESEAPLGLTNVVAIDGNVALKQDGTVFSWSHSNRVSIPALTGVIAISGSLALKQDRTVVSLWPSDTFLQIPPGLGAVTTISDSSTHFLALVSPVCPTILEHPLTQSAEAEAVARLSVRIGPVAFPSYQWFYNTTNALDGATEPVLELRNLQPGQAGAYSVVITNVYGSATSNPAVLQVITRLEKRTVPAIALNGEIGSVHHLSYAHSLADGIAWRELASVTLNNITPQLYIDLPASLPPTRFYRVSQDNPPASLREMQMTEATGITFFGAVGSQLRLDWIQQYGPIDAWVPLATITLTNTVQEYFDLSSFRQPPRLYRVIPLP